MGLPLCDRLADNDMCELKKSCGFSLFTLIFFRLCLKNDFGRFLDLADWLCTVKKSLWADTPSAPRMRWLVGKNFF